MARVSLLMSCHGTGQWLPDALASIPWGDDVEVLVTANGAADAEPVRAALAGYPQARAIYRDATLTLSDSLNYMLCLANAPYVMRLDPDDKLPEGALAEMLDAATDPPVMVYGGFLDFGGRARYVRSKPLTRDVLWDHMPGAYNALVDTTAARGVGGWEEIGYEDWHFFAKLGVRDGLNIVQLDRPTLLHRVRPGSRYEQMVVDNARHIAAVREVLRCVSR